MAKDKGEISYLYVWKKLNGLISDEEEIYLNDWRNSDKENERNFQLFKYFHENKKSVLSKPVFIEASFSKVLSTYKQQQRKKLFLRFAAVAAIVTVVGLLFGGVIFNFSDDVSVLPPLADVSILPGQKEAVLVLSDGSSRELNTNTQLEIQEEQTVIKGSGKLLTYSAKQAEIEGVHYNTLIVPRGAEFFVTLSDSTKVWLNSETTLRYPVHFSKEQREVELIGEAFFEVSKDADRPFRVISNDHVIQVLGTAFNISSFMDQPDILTTLVHGKVVIKDVEDPDLFLELDPGQQAVYNKRNKSAYQHDVDVSIYTSWKDGNFKFKDEPLYKIMETLSRWYAFDVKFENELAKRVKFTGMLKRRQNFEDIIPILESTNDLKIFAYENEIIVK